MTPGWPCVLLFQVAKPQRFRQKSWRSKISQTQCWQAERVPPINRSPTRAALPLAARYFALVLLSIGESAQPGEIRVVALSVLRDGIRHFGAALFDNWIGRKRNVDGEVLRDRRKAVRTRLRRFTFWAHIMSRRPDPWGFRCRWQCDLVKRDQI